MSDSPNIEDIEIKSESGLDHIEVDEETKEVSGDGYYTAQFFKEDLFDANRVTRLVKAAERLVRKSPEYKHYVGFVRESQSLNSCSILGNINTEIENVIIELDHYPFTLYDYCLIVMERFIKDGEKFTTFKIADEVLRLHFRNMVGLVPLSVTMHELRHAGKIFVNLKQVYGNLFEFIKEYKPYIPEELMEKLKELVEKSRDNHGSWKVDGALNYKEQELIKNQGYYIEQIADTENEKKIEGFSDESTEESF